MSTTVTVGEIRGQLQSAEDRRLRKMWSALPETPVDEETAHELILKAAGKWEGDGAWASVMLLTLGNMGAVTRPGGQVLRSETFPIIEDARPGNPRYNELLAKHSEAERERLIAADNAAAKAQYEKSAAGRQHMALLAEVRGIVAEAIEAAMNEVPAIVRDELEDAVPEIRRQRVEELRERLTERAGATGSGEQ